MIQVLIHIDFHYQSHYRIISIEQQESFFREQNARKRQRFMFCASCFYTFYLTHLLKFFFESADLHLFQSKN